MLGDGCGDLLCSSCCYYGWRFSSDIFFTLDTLFFRKGCECSLSRKRQNRAGGSGDGLVDVRLCTQQMCVYACLCVCVAGEEGKRFKTGP